jgi:phosphatidylglycerophosphate synthase
LTSGLSDTRAVPDASAAAQPAGGVAVGVAVVLATAVASDGRPAALLPWEDGTVLGRLLAQLHGLGVPAAVVLARPAFARAVQDALGPGADVRASADVPADLREIAAASASCGGSAAVLYGDLVTHADALHGLLANPHGGTRVLAGGRRRPLTFRFQARRGRLVGATSAYHTVRSPNGAFLGVLRVVPADLAALAATAERLAELAADVPEPWRQELDRKTQRWRAALARAAGEEEGGDDFAGPDEPEEVVDEAAEEEAGAAVLSADEEAQLRTRVAAAPEDAAALLLVGLVRAGVDVTPYYLRRLFWSRPLSPEAAAYAERRIAEYDVDRVLLDSAVKSTDGFFTTFFVSPYSKHIARWAARRGLTPNQVTTVSMLLGVLAAAGFATGERWGLVAGAVLLQVAFTTDCVDGQLARYTRQFSKLGAWLDSVFDRAKEYLAFAGLAIGAARTGDPVWVLACAAITLQTVRHTSDFSYMAVAHQAITVTPQTPIEQPLDHAGMQAAARRRARAAGKPAAPAKRPLATRILVAWQKLDRSRALRWVKRMAAFPIGERFAVISITAALFDARVTFVALLTWGGLAIAYTQTGRVLRSIR